MKFPRLRKFNKRNYKKLLLWFLVLLIVFWGAIFIGAASFNKEIEQKTLVRNFAPIYRLVRKATDIFYLFNIFRPKNFPTYDLVIDPQDFQALNEALPKPYSEVILIEKYQLEVPATFIAEGQQYKVNVRYRGDHNNHWSAAKKSWLIKFDKDNLFEGKSKVHFIIPFDRYYVVSFLNYYRAEKIGLITPQYGYANLRVNGKPNGLYFWVEGGSKELVEKNDKSGEANLYSTINLDWLFGEGVREFSNITPWKQNVSDIIHQYENFAEIDKLIKLVTEADDETFYQQIFDLVDKDSFLKRQVHSLLIASDHQAGANSRLYFNNTTGKFEFMTWNVDQGEPITILDRLYDPLINRIMSNPENIHQRNIYLWDYVKDDKNLEDDLAVYDEYRNKFKVDYYKDPLRVKSYLQFLFDSKRRREWIVEQYQFLQQALTESRAFIEVRLNNPALPQGIVLDVYVDNATDLKFNGLKLRFDELPEAGNWQFYYDQNKNDKLDSTDLVLPVESSDNQRKTVTLDFDDFLLQAYRRIEPDQAFKIIDPTRYRFYLTGTDLDKVNKVRLKLRNYFTDKKPDEVVIRLIDESVFEYFDQINESRGRFLARYPIFRAGADNLVILPAGSYQIRQNIIVPKDIKLQISAGAKLYFAPDISLVSYSPVTINGTQANPVIITAQNPNQPWGVFAILNNKENQSQVTYVKFSYGGDAYINGVSYTGMLASHSSDIMVKNSQFSQATGDDGLNVKNASVEITDNKFFDNNFDGLDLDFTSGQVKNNQFTDNSNDGIDLSGGQNLIFGNQITGSGDKGISVGEESKDIIIDNLIKDGNMGIAVKDLSAPIIINNTIINNQVGIASYQKKQIFGGGQGKVYNSIIWGNNQQITLDNLSTIEVSFSDIQGGYQGENNVNLKPIWLANYLLDEKNPPELTQGGDLDKLREFYPYEAEIVPMGIFE